MIPRSFHKTQLKDFNEFCKKYRIQAREGRPSQRAQPFSYKDWGKEVDFRHLSLNTFSVPTYDLNIEQDSLNQLMDDLAEIDSEEFNEYMRLRKALGEHFVLDLYQYKSKEAREEKARKDNPGVQKSWENYQLMLKLAGGDS